MQIKLTKAEAKVAARLLGARTSIKKALASRANGKLGGRPKKSKSVPTVENAAK